MAVKHKVVRLRSCFTDGVAATYSDIEISLSPGIPTFDIIGLCDSSIRESRGRIQSAIRSLGHPMPKGHITVNITPAYMHKSGSGFDLPIALGILFLEGILPYDPNKVIYAQGEMSLGGDIKTTPGSIIRLMEAARHVNDIVLIPHDEIKAAECSGIKCMPVKTLKEVCDIFAVGAYQGEKFSLDLSRRSPGRRLHTMGELRGQPKAESAITIACAGMHSLLLLGSPGSGKSFAAELIEGLLPPADEYEISQYLALKELIGPEAVSHGAYGSEGRPFRKIYSNCTSAQLNGKAGSLIPGELALANNGVLFADEICDFNAKIIDELKGPLEEHAVHLNKDGKIITVPASFLFVAAGNPCRCGMYYEKPGKCKCTQTMRRNYIGRLSGAFLDRIDIFTEMRSIDKKSLMDLEMNSLIEDDHADMYAREMIWDAWQIQKQRYGWYEGKKKMFNGTCECVSPESFDYDSSVSSFASEAAKMAGLSARGYLKLMRVARTIADMERSVKMTEEHVKRALVFKVQENVI